MAHTDHDYIIKGIKAGKLWYCHPRRPHASWWRAIWQKLDDVGIGPEGVPVVKDQRICCLIQYHLPSEVRQIAYPGFQRNTGERLVPQAEDGYEAALPYSFADNTNKHTFFMTMGLDTYVPPASGDASLQAPSSRDLVA